MLRVSGTHGNHDSITHVTDETYTDAVSDGLVVLDFWAEWCGPCKALEPVIEELVEEYPRLTVAKIGADESDVAMDDFGVQSIPTVILFKDGDPVDVFAGKVPYPKLAQAIEEHH